MASQGARLSKFEADFKQQQSKMTNNIDIVLKAITDRIMGALPSDTVKNPKLNVNPISPVLSTRSYPMGILNAYLIPLIRSMRFLRSWMSFHQALDLIFELDEATVGCTRDILSRLIDGSSCSGIDFVINDLDFEPNIDAIMREFLDPSRWKELSKEMSSTILLCGDRSCRKNFKPIAGLIVKEKLK
nr:ribonuclease H-like domain-containing protein [Tanacetum cinerariifolium]